ncbi:hypothetical protein HNQ07_000435 [Deinococcus metalli]|uniref:DUF1573 domain-containing protein n=1 Tax=Deinococcus metalli TaxID=1141878 RepID=A0A7W8NMS1_9DEIO|nr:hypothetical protein [Deinococcus metalli]MBB5374991.1 hypothetical protein [Deinococcus metalli]GHF32247.1 hypothetical protein GCM10017781_06080 [Deinococcus metalli]
MTGFMTSWMGRRSLERAGALLLTAALMSCSVASTEPTPTTTVVSAQPAALVFSSAQGQASTPQSVALQNPSAEAVTVTSLSVSDSEFELVNPPALPVTLAPGGVLALQVRLKSTGTVGVLRGTLQAQGGAASVALAGLRAKGLEGSNEPPMAQIVDALGYGVNVGWTGLESSTTTFPLGDEVIAPLFVKAGTAAVTIRPVARYSPVGATPFGYFTVSGSAAVRHGVGTLVSGQYQTLNPAVDGAASSEVPFDPGTAAFGVYIDPAAYSYPLTYTKDSLNTGRTAHAVRVYPLKDQAGAVVPNAYLLAFEPSVNGDYQDAVFVIRNVKVASKS